MRQGLSIFKVKVKVIVAPVGEAIEGTATTIENSIYGTEPPLSRLMSEVSIVTSITS